jgi:SHS family lactate transporter-like MFS transporter
MGGWRELFGRGRGKVLAFCWLGWVFDFFDLILFSFTKPGIAAELQLDLYGAIAWIEGLTLLATAVGGFLLGRVADRIGRRPALVASILLYSVGALATASAQGAWSLLLARLVTGLGVGGEWGIGHAVVADVWHGKERDRVHALLQAGTPVAMALAAVVGCFVAPQVGWRAVFAAAAAPALLAAAARWLMPTVGRVAAAAALPARALFAPQYRRTSCVLLLLLTLHMAGFWCVYAQLPSALRSQLELPPATIGWLQLQVSAVHVVADVAFGPLAGRFGRVRVFVGSCLLFAAGHLWLLSQFSAVQGSFGSFTLALALLGLGAGTWSCFGSLFGTHYPPALRGTAAATFYNLSRGVQLLVVPALAAAFRATDSFAPALYVGAAAAVASAAVILLLPRQPVFAAVDASAAGDVEQQR